MPVERREDDAKLWMKEASKKNVLLQSFDSNNYTTTTKKQRPIRVLELPATRSQPMLGTEKIFANKNLRYVIRLDVLNRAELVAYAREKWLGSPKATTSTTSWNEIMTEVNRRGLAGLNEAILETRSGKLGMCLALKLMTLYREDRMTSNPKVSLQQQQQQQENSQNYQTINSCTNDKYDQGLVPIDASIAFHCVQGKDRTGMLAMLIQLLMGCSDEIIVEDYYRSNAEFIKDNTSSSSSSAAAAVMLVSNDNNNNNNKRNGRVRMDASVFSGTNRSAMISTLGVCVAATGKPWKDILIALDSILPGGSGLQQSLEHHPFQQADCECCAITTGTISRT
eukprot:CAMPEP_0116134218 /NCGR_PEP_ID=MMETSP0329-20121206/10529_1 /TAXON_ID=697910 /ORGANISM="Pseudo-nitzschia arenysensis, Strain B593" /LENGTH=337 /DNA_ID=CAMNT_0003628915 /DNA_START=412 /DNA_END=1422 /DNA_ORIENTATION=-